MDSSENHVQGDIGMGAVELIQEYRPNKTIAEALIKADYYLNGRGYQNIVASISGGADSDVVMDICERLKPHGVHYIWFDTGLEYQATKDHLVDLEKKYGIEIERMKAKTPIPVSNKKYGTPFLNKRVSDSIGRLQKFGFQWEDEPFDVLYKKYPKCKSALRWWCDAWDKEDSKFGISRIRFLKEFMLKNPPTYRISNKCCDGAKKNVLKKALKKYNADLNIFGVRKAEGGARADSYDSCFSECKDEADQFRPVWWLTHSDREEYEELFGVEHSKCYTEYGLKRTGCVGCPFAGKNVFTELEVMKEREPKLYNMAWAVFGKSYEYQEQFYQYRAFEKTREKELKGQLSFFDME